MRFAYLGSGSKGNACVIEADNTRLLLDCGFSIKETVRRLARLDLTPSDLSALIVTHEHSDHIAGIGGMARKYDLPVYMTPGTHASNKAGELPHLNLVNSHSAFQLGSLQVQPVPVPHDAKEPCQYVFSHNGLRLGILTDVGHVTPHIQRHYARCDALVVECNHDTSMLRAGPYPPRLKQRVGGNYGHLNNQQAAEFVSQVDFGRLKMVLAVHISEKNNCRELVQTALSDALRDHKPQVQLADQQDGTPWWCLRTMTAPGAVTL